MTVYAVALIDIDDRAEYARYEQGFMAIFERYQGKLLAVDEAPSIVEGDWPHTRTVLLQFPDRAELDRWYHSAAYQELAQHRFNASRGSIVVVRGLSGSGDASDDV
jgi:uncharacterized protein (DUF1330 family)